MTGIREFLSIRDRFIFFCDALENFPCSPNGESLPVRGGSFTGQGRLDRGIPLGPFTLHQSRLRLHGTDSDEVIRPLVIARHAVDEIL